MDLIAIFRKHRPPPDAPILDAALDAEAERFRHADPGTERQWQYLRIALEQAETRERTTRSPARMRIRPGLAFGLTVLALAVAGIFLFRPAVQDVSYSTGKGELSTVLLPDSSEVTLNHTSSLVVDRRSGGKRRHVTLQGEAFFHVHSGGDPFIVSTDAGTVQVLGTQFNVRIREGRLEVAVIRGTVSVSDKISTVVLQAGTMVTCMKDGVLSVPEKILFADYPGWINKKLLFQRSTLQLVCSEIEARFDVRVRIENPALRSETITGALDSRSAEAAVAALASLTGTRYTHEANGFSLY